MMSSDSIEELIAGHAAGRLPQPVAMVVSAHLEMSGRNRGLYKKFNAVGGILLEGVVPEPLQPDAFEQLLQRLDNPSAALKGPARAVPDGRWPRALTGHISEDLTALPWRSYGNAAEAELDSGSADFKLRLIRVKAGRGVPKHTHHGMELTLVLDGAYRDEFGYFGVGDIEIADADIDHQPVADPSGDCLCLAVTDAPLRLTGRIGRFLNPFINV